MSQNASQLLPLLLLLLLLLLLSPTPNISPPGACTLKIALKYKVKRRKKVNFLSRKRLAQSIFKRRFLSVHKPLQK